MSVNEIPVAFEVDGEALIGIVHVPEQAASRGVLAIVAGGPQYRAGCCRQLVQMARALASQGIPVMRFDYRGLGDASGGFRGFRDIGPDLAAAIDAFVANTTGLKEIVLWGGCDAASAAMIHGPNFPIVTGMILGNPFVHSEQTAAKAVVKHYYLRRIRDKAFWKKLLGLRMNPFKVLWSTFSMVIASFARPLKAEVGRGPSLAEMSFQDRMLDGMSRFNGRILLLMSGRSIVSKEYDELVKSSPKWQDALGALDITRIDFPEADQAFSTIGARGRQLTVSLDWLVRYT